MGVHKKEELIDIFKKSNSISIMKGKSNFLTRIPKLTKDQQKFKNPKKKSLQLN